MQKVVTLLSYKKGRKWRLMKSQYETSSKLVGQENDESQKRILDWKQNCKLDTCVASESQKSRKRKLAFTGKNGHAQVDLQSTELPVVKQLSNLEKYNQKKVKEEGFSYLGYHLELDERVQVGFVRNDSFFPIYYVNSRKICGAKI